ncbi:hypothetical protein PR202_gb11296 [Eleusine coracana subsp. coracana]|uniref:Uncharacterized protein n=1 Tax=Eleusine coracana subsp. coracana TaxID=191504 RepID=A0AAV5EMP5_ELECO|nr:hypothetical protein PR202_gb11296 [Eleusine coracana subsp. coracana]
MGYLDLGKWVVALEAGSRFGYDLVLLVLIFNLSAILYCNVWVFQIAGIAVGFNHVFEYGDLITVICFSSVAINLLPYTFSLLGKRMAGILNSCIAGFALLLFVLGLLFSHPQISLSYVQVQRNLPALPLGALFHDHLFSLLFAFSGVFLVNYILLNSGADESKHAIATTFKEAIELTDKVGVSSFCLLWNPLFTTAANLYNKQQSNSSHYNCGHELSSVTCLSYTLKYCMF